MLLEAQAHGAELHQIPRPQGRLVDARAIDVDAIAVLTTQIAYEKVAVGRAVQQRMVAMHCFILEADVVFLVPADAQEIMIERNGPWHGVRLSRLFRRQEGLQGHGPGRGTGRDG